MKTTEEFREFYKKELRADLVRLEFKRKKLKKKSNIVGAVLLAIALSSLLIDKFYFPAFTMVGLFIFLVSKSSIFKEYRIEYKEKVFKRLVGFIEPSLSYDPKNAISRGDFLLSRLFSTPDRYSGEDYFKGTFDKTSIEFSEVHAQREVRDEDNKRHYETIFRGIFVVTEFHKEFDYYTKIVPDSAEKTFGHFGKSLQNLSTKFSSLSLVNLENPEFEKEFAVYSQDQVEARYLITPSFMEQVLKIKKRFNKRIYLAFSGDKLFIGINFNKNLFEGSINKPVDDIKEIEEFFSIITGIIKIVDILKLNNRLWSKK